MSTSAHQVIPKRGPNHDCLAAAKPVHCLALLAALTMHTTAHASATQMHRPACRALQLLADSAHGMHAGAVLAWSLQKQPRICWRTAATIHPLPLMRGHLACLCMSCSKGINWCMLYTSHLCLPEEHKGILACEEYQNGTFADAYDHTQQPGCNPHLEYLEGLVDSLDTYAVTGCTHAAATGCRHSMLLVSVAASDCCTL